MDGPRCGPLTIIDVTRERRGARSAALICAAALLISMQNARLAQHRGAYIDTEVPHLVRLGANAQDRLARGAGCDQVGGD